MHESGEMYLETIYVLSQNSQSVRSLDVAEHMGFSKPSVSRAIGLLKKEGYEVLGCFSGDGYFSKPDGTNVPHSRIDWTQKGCSYETTVLPTYVSFLTTYLGA